MNYKNFEKELSQLINKHSIENKSDTPDFMIAKYLVGCLKAFSNIVMKRDKFYNGQIEEVIQEMGPEEPVPYQYAKINDSEVIYNAICCKCNLSKPYKLAMGKTAICDQCNQIMVIKEQS